MNKARETFIKTKLRILKTIEKIFQRARIVAQTLWNEYDFKKKLWQALMFGLTGFILAYMTTYLPVKKFTFSKILASTFLIILIEHYYPWIIRKGN